MRADACDSFHKQPRTAPDQLREGPDQPMTEPTTTTSTPNAGAPFAAMVRGAYLPASLVGVVLAIAYFVTVGSESGWSALLGTVVTIGFFSAGLLLLSRLVRSADPHAFFAVAMAIGAITAPQIVKRADTKLVVAAGLTLMAAGFAVAATTALLAAVALAATVLVPHLRPVDTAQVAARADPRVEQLLARMSLDDKVGQMTQVDRGALKSTADLATYRIGSLLSGGGSAPTPNTAQSWADMYDNFQRTALSTPLGIPLV